MTDIVLLSLVGVKAVAERMLDGTLREGDTAKLTLDGKELLVTK